ncbi:MAG: MgtC/SapB family protein, partial [Gemmatimonadetes bacterium]|nr:MgtC/SapB family protein [Gemmatimonadota bacterium]
MQDLIASLTSAIPADVLDQLALLGRLLLAAVLGGVIGLERELSGKPAGLRTNLLICVGAALLMDLSIAVAALANLPNEQAGAIFRADPARIAAQIVSGIGFLGAGTILQARGNIIGLTTAATIWVVAAIGMAVG